MLVRSASQASQPKEATTSFVNSPVWKASCCSSCTILRTIDRANMTKWSSSTMGARASFPIAMPAPSRLLVLTRVFARIVGLAASVPGRAPTGLSRQAIARSEYIAGSSELTASAHDVKTEPGHVKNHCFNLGNEDGYHDRKGPHRQDRHRICATAEAGQDYSVGYRLGLLGQRQFRRDHRQSFWSIPRPLSP